MTLQYPNIPDFTMEEPFHPKRITQFERLLKLGPRDKLKRSTNINTDLSFQPSQRFSSARSKPQKYSRTDSKKYYNQQEIGLNLQPKRNVPHKHGYINDDYAKCFPNFKSPYNEYYQKSQFPLYYPSDESSSEYSSNEEFQERYPIHDDVKCTHKILGQPNCTNCSKKVKWQDGYEESNSSHANYGDYYRYGFTPNIRTNYSYDNIPNYMSQDHPYIYNNSNYGYYSSDDFYRYESPYYYQHSSPEFHNGYQQYSPTNEPLYTDPCNWLFMENQGEQFSPYYYTEYNKDNTNTCQISSKKSFKNSNTQYDLVNRVHNKKLQVTQSENFKNKSRINEDKKMNITESNQSIKEKEISETNQQCNNQNENQKLPTNPDISKECNNLNETFIINRFLVELTEKLKSTNDSVSSMRNKSNIVDQDTQYIDTDFRRTRSGNNILKKKRKIFRHSTDPKRSSKRPIRMRHETTQSENITEGPKKIKPKTYRSKSVATDSTLYRPMLSNNPKRRDFCKIQSSEKRTALKGGICEERIYATRLVKKNIECGNVEIKNFITDNRSNAPESSSRNRQFLGKSEDKHKNAPSPFEKIEYMEKRIRTKKQNTKSFPEKNNFLEIDFDEKLFDDQDNSASETDLNLCDTKVENISSSETCVRKSDFSSPEEEYLEKYTIKLTNPKQNIALYNVKSKLYNHMKHKGVKKKIIEKLSCGENR